MPSKRRYVVAGTVAAIAVVAGIVLSELFATVLLAITVAYVLTPVQEWFLGRGWTRWRASAVTSGLAVAVAVVVALPLAIVVYRRRAALLAILDRIPDSVTVEAFGSQVVLTAGDLVEAGVSYLPAVAVDVAVFVSAVSIKMALFGIIVFGLLLGHERARQALLAPVPPAYLDIVEALEERARETLVAILVLQVGTAVGTFVIAVPVFVLLGYRHPFVLGTIAGVLQFLPIIGPILLIAGLAAFHLFVGQVVAAATVLIVGGVAVGWLPDVLIRPRLARWSGALPGSLYFIGFIGGLTSLGAIGVIAGPLVVALLVEGIGLLADEMDHAGRPATDGPAPD